MADTTPEDRLDELAARLRLLEDRLEIGQLFIDYGRHLDRGEFAAYAELFARDGELLLGPMARAKGRDEIRRAMEEAMAGRVGSSVHVVSSPAIELDGDRATAEVMWTVVVRTGDDLGVTMVGRHVDELVREDGRWRFQRRKGMVDLSGANGRP